MKGAKPEVGQQLYVVDDWSGKCEWRAVTKVGTRYFYIGDPKYWTNKFRISDWHSDSSSLIWQAYGTESEYQDERKKRQFLGRFHDEFSLRRRAENKFTLDQLQEAARILGIDLEGS